MIKDGNHRPRVHAGSFISTPARSGQCRGCRKRILVGYDRGLLTTVDHRPLADDAAELAALLEGKITYGQLHDRSLCRREAPEVAGGITGPTFAEHRCNPAQIVATGSGALRG